MMFVLMRDEMYSEICSAAQGRKWPESRDLFGKSRDWPVCRPVSRAKVDV